MGEESSECSRGQGQMEAGPHDRIKKIPMVPNQDSRAEQLQFPPPRAPNPLSTWEREAKATSAPREVAFRLDLGTKSSYLGVQGRVETLANDRGNCTMTVTWPSPTS